MGYLHERTDELRRNWRRDTIYRLSVKYSIFPAGSYWYRRTEIQNKPPDLAKWPLLLRVCSIEYFITPHNSYSYTHSPVFGIYSYKYMGIIGYYSCLYFQAPRGLADCNYGCYVLPLPLRGSANTLGGSKRDASCVFKSSKSLAWCKVLEKSQLEKNNAAASKHIDTLQAHLPAWWIRRNIHTIQAYDVRRHDTKVAASSSDLIRVLLRVSHIFFSIIAFSRFC